MYLLGYDLGSSSVKATLLDADKNQIVASAQYPKTEMPMLASQPGWAEQEPEMWWNAVKEVTTEIFKPSQVTPSLIEAIGITYQMHGLVVVDKNQEVLRPAIIWCDSRAVQIGEEANLKIGSEYCHSNLLNSPGNFTAAKLAWVAQNEPEIFDRIDKFMLPGDFIAMKMSGQAQTTFSGLSEGIFYDFVNDEVSSPLMNYFGFDSSVIPQIVPTFGIQSELSESAATFLGLKKGTKITYRAGDQPNNALSLNVLNPGEIAATAGTSGVVYGISDVLDNDPHSRVNAFRHVNHTDDQRRIGILLCINGTGILNAWARRNFGDHSYEEMNDLAMQVPPGSTGLTVLPFGNGAERLLSNKDIGAHISGLQFNIHDKRHVFRAIQEGIACSLKYGIEIMEDMNLKAQTIRAGKANLFLSPLFQKTLSNLTGATIEMYDTDGAQGAARGAGIGIGRFTETSAFDGLKLLNRVEPEADSKAQYAEIYQAWKQQLSHMI